MSQLEDIRVTYHVYGLGVLKARVFDVWLKNYPSASWSDLISALKSMNEHRVASDIAARYSHQVMIFITLSALVLIKHYAGTGITAVSSSSDHMVPHQQTQHRLCRLYYN